GAVTRRRRTTPGSTVSRSRSAPMTPRTSTSSATRVLSACARRIRARRGRSSGRSSGGTTRTTCSASTRTSRRHDEDGGSDRAGIACRASGLVPRPPAADARRLGDRRPPRAGGPRAPRRRARGIVRPAGRARAGDGVTALPIRQPLGKVVGRHSLAVEAIGVLALYALYEATRGVIAGDRVAAVRHADDIASLERSLHVFVEGRVQDAAGTLPGLIGALGLLYLTMHLTVTGVYLLWLHRRRPGAFPFVRTTLLIASALALIGFLVFPTAPPRAAALGISDTISSGHVNLNHGLISSLYNPFAAVPSMHVGYAVIVAASLVRHGGDPPLPARGARVPRPAGVVVVAAGPPPPHR